MKRLRSIVAARLEPKSRREMEDAAMIAYTASLVSTERSHVPCVDRGHLDKIHCATENPYKRCCSGVQVLPAHLGLDLSRRVQLLQRTGFHRCFTSIRDHSLPCICFGQQASTDARPRCSLGHGGIIISAAKVCAGLMSTRNGVMKLTDRRCISVADKAQDLSVEGGV